MDVPFSVGDKIPLKIDRLSYDGGRGVGRFQNFVVFVSDTAPDEEIFCEITDIKKSFAEAKLLEIAKASPHRRKPPCPVAGRCGGCVWQHVNYAEQVRQKENLLAHQLRRLLPEELKNPKVIPSPSEFRYRNRVQLHSQNKEFGFFAKGTNTIVPIEDCLISEEALFTNLESELHSPGKTKWELMLGKDGRRVIRDLKEEESEFTQVNSAQNANLQEIVVQELKKTPPYSQIYDLFCGAGNLGFPIAEAFPDIPVIAVELANSAIRRAKKAQTSQKISFNAQDVGEYLKNLKIDKIAAFVLDPPRAGLGKLVVKETLRLQPKLVIYVSCNLATLARDLEVLTQSVYRVESVKGLDMFPQTEYLETIVTLVPR